MSYYPTNGLGASASVSASASLSVGAKKPAPKKPAPKKPAPKKPGLITSFAAKIAAATKSAADAKKKAQIEAARKAASAAASKPGTPKAASVPAARPALLSAAGHAIKAASTPVARPALLSESGAKANADVMNPEKQSISTDGKCYAGKVLFENRGISFCMPPAAYAQMQLEKAGPAVVSVKPEDAINSDQKTVEVEPKSNLPLKIAVGGLIAAGAITLIIVAS
jgi:hypothetical protein